MIPRYQAVVISRGDWFECTFSRFPERSDLYARKEHYASLPGFQFNFRADENVVTVFINKGYTIDDVLRDFKELLNSLGFAKISWEVWRWDKEGREITSSSKSEILEEVLTAK